MADIRIKDLPTTATQTASDDFIALDGTVNGTRKIDASAPSFKTSVTSPSIVAPAATNLTLTGGSTGASLVLGQGASGNLVMSANSAERARLTTTGNLLIGTTTDTNSRLKLVGADSSGPKTWTASSAALSGALFDSYQDSGGNGFQRYTDIVSLQDSDGVNGGGVIRFVTNSISSDSGTEAMRVTKLQNLLIGGTTDITGSGGLKVFGTTAASSTTTGALQVAGGVGVAGAGYFGGAVTAGTSGTALIVGTNTGATTARVSAGTDTTARLELTETADANGGWIAYEGASNRLRIGTNLSGSDTAAINIQRASSQVDFLGAATFAGAVTVNNTTAGSAGAGALVVSGGLATGAASYFGGAVTSSGQILSANTGLFSTDATLSNYSATNGVYLNGNAGGWLRLKGDGTGASNIQINGGSTGNITVDAGSATRLTINGTTGAATFAGAVTAGGLVTAGQAGNVSATNSLLAKGYAVGGFGDYGSILLNATAANTSGARQFLVTNAHNATGFAIVRSTNSTTPPTLNTSGVVSSGTADFTISNAGVVGITNTTAGSAGAGALVVSGGLATGAASYFGGAVTLSGTSTQLNLFDTGSGTSRNWRIATSEAAEGDCLIQVSSAAGLVPSISALGFDRTGAATFAGAVTVSGVFAARGTGASSALWLGDDGADGWFMNVPTGNVITLGIANVSKVAINTNTTILSNALRVNNAYVATPVVSTGYITIQDSSGTTYKVAVSL